jgi:hypothetical protein
MEQMVFDRIAELSPEERIRVATNLTQSVLAIARATLRQQYPAAGEEEIRYRLCARMYGRETMVRFFGEAGLRWCE